MSTTIQVPGGFELSSNHETPEEMLKAVKPAKADGAEPRVVVKGGVAVAEEPATPLSEAASALGKAGGKAAAEAKAKAAKELKPEVEDKPKPEAKEPETKEDPSKESKPESESEGHEDDKGSPDKSKAGDPRKDPRARIHALTQERAEERARRIDAERERDALRAKAAPAGDDDPQMPTRAQFQNDEEYIEAKADYKFQKREKEETQRRERVEKIARFNERIAHDPEFSKHVDQRLLEMRPAFMLQAGEPLGPDNVIASALMDSDQSYELFLHLTEHPEEMVKLISLPNPGEIMRAIGRLETKLAKVEPEAAPEPERESKAPAPIKPLTPTTVPGNPDITGDIDFDTFLKRRGSSR